MDTFNQVVKLAQERGEPEDFQRVANILAREETKDDNELLDGLRVLLYHAPLKGFGDKYASICEKYLYRTDKPFVSSKVLIMLCSYVYSTTRYKDYIKQALRGHEWDTERDLQSSASVLAKSLFDAKQDNEIICILIEVLNSGQETQFSYIYEALLKIVGISIDIPWRSWVQNAPKSIVDWNLVKQLSQTYRCE